MINLKVDGTREELLRDLVETYPTWPELLAHVREYAPKHHKEVWEEQAIAIAILAAQYDRRDASILEWGTNRGMTAALLKLAAPQATVATLEPNQALRRPARHCLAPLGMRVLPWTSVAYLDFDESTYDMIFVDGDHKNARLDLPWMGRLKVGGLFLWHDFSPKESSRPCPPVFRALTEFSRVLDHEPDVLVRDETGTGLAGWYRREGEQWHP